MNESGADWCVTVSFIALQLEVQGEILVPACISSKRHFVEILFQ